MRKLTKAYTWLIFIFLYAPMLVLILLSFNTTKDRVNIDGFTLHWYQELFKSGVLLQLLLNTLILATLSAILSTALGTMAAVGINAMNTRMRRLVMTVTNIPLTNPDIVTGISLALLFVFVGNLFRQSSVMGFATLLIAHITFNLPYIILSVMPKLKQMDRHLTDAALDLGCTPFQSFFKVTLPEILPGVLAGGMMAFTYSLDDFVISYFVYGPGFSTLPIEIYSYTKKPLSPTIYALFTLMFAAILILLLLVNVIQANDHKKAVKVK